MIKQVLSDNEVEKIWTSLIDTNLPSVYEWRSDVESCYRTDPEHRHQRRFEWDSHKYQHLRGPQRMITETHRNNHIL